MDKGTRFRNSPQDCSTNEVEDLDRNLLAPNNSRERSRPWVAIDFGSKHINYVSAISGQFATPRLFPRFSKIGIDLKNTMKVKISIEEVLLHASNVLPKPNNGFPRMKIRRFSRELVNSVNNFAPHG